MMSLSSPYADSVDGISQKMYAGKRRRRPVKRNPTHTVVEVKSNPSKRHRDRLNAELDRLASLLPFDADTISKLDKLSILRLSVSYLRSKSYFNVSIGNKDSPNGAITDGHNGHQRMLPSVGQTMESVDFDQPDSSSSRSGLNLEGEAEMLVHAMNGFLLVVQQDGQVMFASPSIQEYLGFQDADVMHQSVYDLIHKDDRSTFQQQLKYESCHDYPEDVDNPDSQAALERNFTARLRCLLDESSGFLNLQITGRLRPLYGQRIRGEDGVPVDVDPPEMALFAIVCPMQQPSIMEIYVRNMIFRTKHQLNFKPITLDSKAEDILGYNETEFKLMAGYHYVHYEDIIYCSEMHSCLVRKGESGFIYFRLLSKSSKWLWVQAKGRVIYKSGKPDYLVSTHRPMSDEEGEQHLNARGEPFKFPFSGKAELYGCNPPYPPIPIPKAILEGRAKFPAGFPPFGGEGPPPFPAGSMPPGFPPFPGDGPPPGFPPFPGDGPPRGFPPPNGFPPGRPPPGFEGGVPQMPAGVDLPGLSSPASRQLERRPKLVARRQLTKPSHGTPPPNVTVNPASGSFDFNPMSRLPSMASSSVSRPPAQVPQSHPTQAQPSQPMTQREILKQELRKFTQAFQKVSMREEANARAMAERGSAARNDVLQTTAVTQPTTTSTAFPSMANTLTNTADCHSSAYPPVTSSHPQSFNPADADNSEQLDFDTDWIVLKTSPQSVDEDFSESCALAFTVPPSSRSGASSNPYPNQQSIANTSNPVSDTASPSSSNAPRSTTTTATLSHPPVSSQQASLTHPLQTNPLDLIGTDEAIPSFSDSLAPITIDDLIPSLTPCQNLPTDLSGLSNSSLGSEPQTGTVRPMQQSAFPQESPSLSTCAWQQVPAPHPNPQGMNSPRVPPAPAPDQTNVFDCRQDPNTVLDFSSMSEESLGLDRRQESMSTTSSSSPCSSIDNDSTLRTNWPTEQNVSSPPDIKYPLTDEQFLACTASLGKQNNLPSNMNGFSQLGSFTPTSPLTQRNPNHHTLAKQQSPQQLPQYHQPHNMSSPRQAYAPDTDTLNQFNMSQQALIQESLTEQNFVKCEPILKPNQQQQLDGTLINQHIPQSAYPGTVIEPLENGFPGQVNGYDAFPDTSQDLLTPNGDFNTGLNSSPEAFMVQQEFENMSGNYPDPSLAFQQQAPNLQQLQQQQRQQQQQQRQLLQRQQQRQLLQRQQQRQLLQRQQQRQLLQRQQQRQLLQRQQQQQLLQRQQQYQLLQQQQPLNYVPDCLDVTTTPEQLYLNGVP